MSEPLTLEELRELEKRLRKGVATLNDDDLSLRAVLELIALREDPHLSDEDHRGDRLLRKAAEALRGKLAAIREKFQCKPTWEAEFLAVEAALEGKPQEEEEEEEEEEDRGGGESWRMNP